MNHDLRVERDENGVWVAQVPSVHGCISQGDSREEALSNVADALQTCLQVRAEQGMPPIKERRIPQFGTAAGQVKMADDFDDIPEGFEDYI